MATDITLDSLTNGTITTSSDNEYVWDGTGVFDELIKAVNSNIKIEYDNGRITGPDYANVYLGALQSVIAQSIQYVLQEKQIEAQTDLLVTQKNEAELDGAAKRAEIAAQTQLLIDQDSELRLNGVKDRELKDKQIGNLTSEITVREAQSNKDLLLKDKQITVEASRALQIDCETDKCKKLTFKEMRGITYTP